MGLRAVAPDAYIISIVNNERQASIVLVLGASGAGKSASVRVKLKRIAPPRLLGFDPGSDFGEFGVVTDDLRDVARGVALGGHAGPFRFVFRPSFDDATARDQFNKLCRLALAAGNCCFVADELEDVVLPSWAPPFWRGLVREGRKRGCRVIALSQDPAGIEKRIWRLWTVLRSGVLNDDEGAARRVAAALMVQPLEVMTLPELSWIERDRRAGVVRRGRIEWRAGEPREVIESEKKLLLPALVP